MSRLLVLLVLSHKCFFALKNFIAAAISFAFNFRSFNVFFFLFNHFLAVHGDRHLPVLCCDHSNGSWWDNIECHYNISDDLVSQPAKQVLC